MTQNTDTPRTDALITDDDAAEFCAKSKEQLFIALTATRHDRAALRAALAELLAKRFPASDFGDDPRWADVARAYALLAKVQP